MSRRWNISTPLLISAIALTVIVVMLLSESPKLVAAALGPTATDADPEATLAELLASHEATFDTYQKRFNGRSAFFKPAQWPRRPPPPPPPRDDPPPVVVEQTPVEPPGPPPPPSSYMGPKVLFAIGDTVFFESPQGLGNDLVVAEGEERDGVRVIETNLPWSIKIGHRGGEYDVEYIKSVDPFADATRSPERSTPGLVVASGSEEDPSASMRPRTVDDRAGADDLDDDEEGIDDEDDDLLDIDDEEGEVEIVDGDDEGGEIEIVDGRDRGGDAGQDGPRDATSGSSDREELMGPPVPSNLRPERRAPDRAPARVRTASEPLEGPPVPPGLALAGADEGLETPRPPGADRSAQQLASPGGSMPANPRDAGDPVRVSRPRAAGRPAPAPPRASGGRPSPEQRPPASAGDPDDDVPSDSAGGSSRGRSDSPDA